MDSLLIDYISLTAKNKYYFPRLLEQFRGADCDDWIHVAFFDSFGSVAIIT